MLHVGHAESMKNQSRLQWQDETVKSFINKEPNQGKRNYFVISELQICRDFLGWNLQKLRTFVLSFILPYDFKECFPPLPRKECYFTAKEGLPPRLHPFIHHMTLFCPLWITCCVPQQNIVLFPFLTKPVGSAWLDIDLFFRVYGPRLRLGL